MFEAMVKKRTVPVPFAMFTSMTPPGSLFSILSNSLHAFYTHRGPTLIRLLRRGIVLEESDPELSHVGDSQTSVWTLLTLSDTAHFPFDSGSPRCVSWLGAPPPPPPPPDAALRLPATGGATLFFSAMDGVTLRGVSPQFCRKRLCPERSGAVRGQGRAIV